MRKFRNWTPKEKREITTMLILQPLEHGLNVTENQKKLYLCKQTLTL